MYEGSWILFTKSRYLLNRGLLNRGLGVCTFTLVELISQDLGSQPVLLLSKLCIGRTRANGLYFLSSWHNLW